MGLVVITVMGRLGRALEGEPDASFEPGLLEVPVVFRIVGGVPSLAAALARRLEGAE